MQLTLDHLGKVWITRQTEGNPTTDANSVKKGDTGTRIRTKEETVLTETARGGNECEQE